MQYGSTATLQIPTYEWKLPLHGGWYRRQPGWVLSMSLSNGYLFSSVPVGRISEPWENRSCEKASSGYGEVRFLHTSTGRMRYRVVRYGIPWSAETLAKSLSCISVSWHWRYLNLIWCLCTQNYTAQETQSWKECPTLSGQFETVATAIKRLSSKSHVSLATIG